MSAFGLARQLGIERGAAQELRGPLLQRYPGVRAFMDRIRAQAREDGYVETLFGRRLYLPDIDHSNQRRPVAERTAINAPMQGTRGGHHQARHDPRGPLDPADRPAGCA